MKALTIDEVCARLSGARDPLILVHTKPDGDALGSAAALYHFFLARGQKPAIASPDPIPARLSFLTDGLSLSNQPEAGRTVIAVDVASPSQLGALQETFLTGAIRPSLMIDHHAVGIPFADHYVLPEAAATGEVLCGVFAHLHDSALWTTPLCTSLYAAISSDTGCFRYSNATPATHRAAAQLLSFGVDGAAVNHLLFDSKSREQIAAEGIVAAKIQTAAGGRIAYAVISRADIDGAGLADEHFETAIDIVRSLRGATVAFTLKEQKAGGYRASLRSTGADMASVAAAFGGGGHLRAAGCSLTGMTAEAAVAALLDKLAPAALE